MGGDKLPSSVTGGFYRKRSSLKQTLKASFLLVPLIFQPLGCVIVS